MNRWTHPTLTRRGLAPDFTRGELELARGPLRKTATHLARGTSARWLRCFHLSLSQAGRC